MREWGERNGMRRLEVDTAKPSAVRCWEGALEQTAAPDRRRQSLAELGTHSPDDCVRTDRFDTAAGESSKNHCYRPPATMRDRKRRVCLVSVSCCVVSWLKESAGGFRGTHWQDGWGAGRECVRDSGACFERASVPWALVWC
jgi:hypothetical protein